MERVAVGQNVLKENDRIAAELRAGFLARRTVCLNVISSPGAGKTSLLEQTLGALAGARWRVAVLTGDIQTDRDAARLGGFGFPALQITTGGTCHLDASMVRKALAEVPSDLDLLLIENVGNLVCPASYDLGEEAKVVLLSVAEGDDKPMKYPAIFRQADAVIVSKLELASLAGFDLGRYEGHLRRQNSAAPLFALSAKSGAGMGAWADWLAQRTVSR